jgi:hypothetical protein
VSKGLPERASCIVRGELSEVVLMKVFATQPGAEYSSCGTQKVLEAP